MSMEGASALFESRPNETSLQPGVIGEIDDDQDHGMLTEKPYREQGNPNWYSTHSLRARLCLRRDPTIIAILEMFWKACTARLGTCEIIHHPQYVALHMRMTKALSTFPQCDRKFDFHESWQIAIEDWERDSRKGDTMDK